MVKPSSMLPAFTQTAARCTRVPCMPYRELLLQYSGPRALACGVVGLGTQESTQSSWQESTRASAGIDTGLPRFDQLSGRFREEGVRLNSTLRLEVARKRSRALRLLPHPLANRHRKSPPPGHQERFITLAHLPWGLPRTPHRYLEASVFGQTLGMEGFWHIPAMGWQSPPESRERFRGT